MQTDTPEVRNDAAGEVANRELRLDFSHVTLSNRRATPQGGLVVDANIARTGILEYRNPDGSLRREYRPAEEVFHPDALASFAHAPVTVDHPGGLVTPLNWREVTHGHIAGAVKADGKFVAGELHIQDASAVRKAEKGELRELSCGYQCRLDRTPGVFEGQPYDAVQRDIRGNHVALGPPGWGRSGSDVRIRLDSAASVSGLEADAYVPTTMPLDSPPPAKPVTPTPPAATAPAPNAADVLAGENAALKAENARLTADAAARSDAASTTEQQARFDAAVKARVTLVAAAAPLMGAAWRDDGKTDDQIRREVLAKLEPTLVLPEAKADGAAGFVTGAYTAAVSRADRATTALSKTRDASPGGRGPRTAAKRADSTGTDTGALEDGSGDVINDSRGAMVRKQADNWKKPRTKAERGAR